MIVTYHQAKTQMIVQGGEHDLYALCECHRHDLMAAPRVVRVLGETLVISIALWPRTERDVIDTIRAMNILKQMESEDSEP